MLPSAEVQAWVKQVRRVPVLVKEGVSKTAAEGWWEAWRKSRTRARVEEAVDLMYLGWHIERIAEELEG